MRLALAQMQGSNDINDNLTTAINLINQAKSQGAELIILPEACMSFLPNNQDLKPHMIAQSVDGEFASSLIKLSAELDIAIVFGFYEKTKGQKALNSVIFADKGEIVYKYSKTHLYDAFSFLESQDIEAGDKLGIFQSRFGKMAIMVCYELRFPEIARSLALQGAELIIVPAAWTKGELKDEHFSILTKARALENTVFVCAVSQCGGAFAGRSLLINPLGIEEAKLGKSQGIQVVDVDFGQIKEARKLLPCLQQRKEKLYKLNFTKEIL